MAVTVCWLTKPLAEERCVYVCVCVCVYVCVCMCMCVYVCALLSYQQAENHHKKMNECASFQRLLIDIEHLDLGMCEHW